MPDITDQMSLDMYRKMTEIRLFEKRAHDLFLQNLVKGTTHLGTGQEAVAAGVSQAMNDDDYMFVTYRGHNHVLARGTPMTPVMAELLGRENGLMHGKGGSMHLLDVSRGILGAYAIVGAQLVVANGAAWSAKYRGTGQVTVCYLGDGATNIGAFHESANLAAVMHLPVVFVCENNGYSEFTPQERHMLLKDVADRAAAYGMPGETVDGMDAVAVYLAARRLVARARAGEGPALLEAKTYRYYDHQGVKGLRIPYRTQEEIDTWKERDAISSLEQRAVDAKVAAREGLEKVWADTREEIAAAIKFAEESPDPDPADLLDNVYTV